MKQGRAVLAALILVGGILAGGLEGRAALSPDGNERALDHVDSPLFTLDTRGIDGALTALFSLDTRDVDEGAYTLVFTLDTRGGMEPQTRLFTLDTRGLDLSYAPQNLQVVAEQSTVAGLSWEYNGTPLGFVVERRLPLGDWTSTSLSGGAVRSWEDPTVEAGQFYEYRAAAILSSGVSAYSELAYIQMPALSHTPQELTATLTLEDHVALTWLDLSHDEDGFEIWRKDGAEGIWSPLALSEANTTSLVDSAVSSATLYTYKLRAFNEWGNSGFSEEASVAIPDSGSGCGWELLVNDATLSLDGIPVSLGGQPLADSRALLEGVVWAFIKSPRGNPHPARVVLGFRDDTGSAVGTPVEWIDFYCVPGCPGISIEAEIPASFRAPEAGSNTLWAEMIMSQRDPVDAFMTQWHTQESPMRKRLLDVAIRTEAVPETRIRLLDEATTPGAVVEVPVELISDGGETMISFSVVMDDGLQWMDVLQSPDLPQGLFDTSGSSNTLGVTLLAPLENPLGAGTKHLLTLQLMAEDPGEYDLQFVDAPVERAVFKGTTNQTPITWENSVVTVAVSGWEGDVSPQPSGDGVVDKQDVRLARQFALGVLELPTDPWEFQRLDCAPTATCGDGQINMADVVAILHKVVHSSELVPACGPTNLLESPPSASVLLKTSSLRNLLLTAPEEIQRGESFWASIDLTAQGDEHGMSMSISFDSEVLAYQDLRLLGPATNGVFLSNLDELENGLIALGLTLSADETYTAGTQPVVEINFMALEGNGTVVTPLGFVQSPAECLVVGLNSELLEFSTSGSDVIVTNTISPLAPLPPETAQAVALAMDQIQVSWASVSWATGYRVRRKLEGETVWTQLEDCDESRTVFVDDGLPSGTLCQYLITSLNPQGEESSVIRVEDRTWTALEQWRHAGFEQIENTGQAADAADPDGDGLPNLMEYQLGTDPLIPDNQVYQLALEEVFTGTESMTISYAVLDGAPGQITFEFTEHLLGAGSLWRSNGLAPVSLRRAGNEEQIKVRLPESTLSNQMLFLRMKTGE